MKARATHGRGICDWGALCLLSDAFCLHWHPVLQWGWHCWHAQSCTPSSCIEHHARAHYPCRRLWPRWATAASTTPPMPAPRCSSTTRAAPSRSPPAPHRCACCCRLVYSCCGRTGFCHLQACLSLAWLAHHRCCWTTPAMMWHPACLHPLLLLLLLLLLKQHLLPSALPLLFAGAAGPHRRGVAPVLLPQWPHAGLVRQGPDRHHLGR